MRAYSRVRQVRNGYCLRNRIRIKRRQMAFSTSGFLPMIDTQSHFMELNFMELNPYYLALGPLGHGALGINASNEKIAAMYFFWGKL